ncbi:hypothetical protein BGZ70_007919 [Mortierella alpina]|uniref:TAFII55 protein conserved region domain-containing protein n=1 Tax=Mortierella alpina TaxID=64518 RepID=A0A9P6M6S1_MORAP|nr:hypothetical protein BGZ70_007919 [Mortierella alpina]
MSNPGSGFNPNLYPQPIGTLSGSAAAAGSAPFTSAGANSTFTGTAGAGMSIAPRTDLSGESNAAAFATSSQPMAPLPITSPPVGTAPRKQLAAAAAAGAAAGAASTSKSGRQKGTNKKGTGAGTGRRGGRGGGRGGRSGGASGSGAGGGSAGDDDEGAGGGGKDSDDDNEDEPEVSIEEQFILRLPPGEMCDRFREKVVAREVDESVKLRFTDARRGTFTFEGLDFPTKLVDLPTIIEAQKTLNGKQMYKIADISQMLLVDPVPAENNTHVKSEPMANGDSRNSMPAPTLPPLKPSEYIWPDGLTNPLKNVRKRRFRKRVSKVAVEGVENEIERLLQEDAQAEEVVYEIREQIDGMDRFDSDDGATPAPEGAHSDMDMEMEGEGDEDEEEDEQYDEDLFAEIEREIGIEGGENATDEEGDDAGTPQRQDSSSTIAGSPANIGPFSTEVRTAGLAASDQGMTTDTKVSASALVMPSAGTSVDRTAGGSDKRGVDDDEEEDDEEEDEEEDDDDDDSGSEDEEEEEEEEDKERAQLEKLLKDEIRELNGKVRDNEEKVQSAPNDILKRRFGSILENLRKELKLKTDQLDEVKDRGKSKGK